MQQLFCTLFLLLVSLSLFSQDVVYRYDSSGNRISRSVVSDANRVKKSGVGYNKRNLAVEKSQSSSVLSYNKAADMISVKLDNRDINAGLSLSVYTLSGSLVYSQSMSKSDKAFSMSSVPAGTYIASIDTSARQYTLKFTKE